MTGKTVTDTLELVQCIIQIVHCSAWIVFNILIVWLSLHVRCCVSTLVHYLLLNIFIYI